MTWDSKPLGQVAELQRGFDLPAARRESGPYPVVSSAGVIGNHAAAVVPGPGVVAGRVGSIGEVYYIPGDFWPLNTTFWVKSFHGNDTRYVYHLLKQFDFEKFSFKSGVRGVNRSQLHKVLVPAPPVAAQRHIASALDAWDTAVSTTERLISAFAARHAGMRERCLRDPPRSQRVQLAALTCEATARNGRRLGRDRVMAVTKQAGMRSMKPRSMAANIERYKIVPPSAFAYNPMRLNIGSIALSSFHADVLVSPDYVVFECDRSRLLPEYLDHYRRTRRWAKHFSAAGSGGVRVRVYYRDLCAHFIPLPSLDEQRRAVALLDAAATEIGALTRYADALRAQKRVLRRKLVNGEWRLDGEAESGA